MRVLFATNLSEPIALTDEVERLARQLDAELFVLHVISPAQTAAIAPIDPMTGLSGFAPYTLYDPRLEANMEEAEEHAFKAFLIERFRIPVQAGIRKGEPSPLILEDANEHDVDYVVVGKRRHTRLEQFFVGSTAQDVIKKSRRPTIVLPVEEPSDSTE